MVKGDVFKSLVLSVVQSPKCNNNHIFMWQKVLFDHNEEKEKNQENYLNITQVKKLFIYQIYFSSMDWVSRNKYKILST